MSSYPKNSSSAVVFKSVLVVVLYCPVAPIIATPSIIATLWYNIAVFATCRHIEESLAVLSAISSTSLYSNVPGI